MSYYLATVLKDSCPVVEIEKIPIKLENNSGNQILLEYSYDKKKHNISLINYSGYSIDISVFNVIKDIIILKENNKHMKMTKDLEYGSVFMYNNTKHIFLGKKDTDNVNDAGRFRVLNINENIFVMWNNPDYIVRVIGKIDLKNLADAMK